jgi:hypothetical protein
MLFSICFSYAFLIALIKKKIYVSHMFTEHMLLLYVSCIKFLINRFVKKFCPYITVI